MPSNAVAIAKQTEFVLARQERVAQAAGTMLSRAAHVWSLLTNVRNLGPALDVQRKFFEPNSLPATSSFGVEKLTVAGAQIEIDGILANAQADREIIPFTDAYPVEGACASAAVRVDRFVFVSSLTAIDTSGVTAGAQPAREFPHFVSSVKLQTEFILRRLKGILARAGTSLDNVVKAQVFLPNLAHFAEFDEVWQAFFPRNPPARAVIPAKLSSPRCLLEINAIAIIPDGRFQKEIIHTDHAPTPSIHEPQAVKAGPFVFLSQLMATDYRTGVPSVARVNPQFPNHDSEVRRQLAYIFENADAILEAAGSSLKDIVRRQGFYSTFVDNLGPGRDLTLTAFSPDPSPSTNVSLGTTLIVPGCVYLFDAVAVSKSA